VKVSSTVEAKKAGDREFYDNQPNMSEEFYALPAGAKRGKAVKISSTVEAKKAGDREFYDN